MAKKKSSAANPKVDSIRHKESRTNIPTEELRDFVADDEAKPKTMLYPRDPSLDPQLVWKGKDEQDQQDLAVPVVPIYIQEKIHPHAIINDLQARSKEGHREEQLSFFSDFNGIEDFDKKVDFYHHEYHWSNRMILGDSLLVMTSLAEKEGLKGKVQMIYIDPPYGIKYGSNWQVSTRKREVKDGKPEDTTRQPEQIRAFRDTWKYGIHTYLGYLRDRLITSRELLTESGSVFVQIGEENVHLVRSVLDEVFGSENSVSLITFRTTANLVGNYLGRNGDFIIWFAKDITQLKYRQLYQPRTLADDVGGRYTRIELADGSRRFMNDEERNDPANISAHNKVYRHDNLSSQDATPSGTFWYEFQGQSFHPGSSRHWTTGVDGLNRLAAANRLAAPSPNSLAYIRYLDDFPVSEYTNVWTDTQSGAFTDDKLYVVQTNQKVILRCILMSTDPGDLVLDPTCGSGTTAHVAEQWGRRWITVDTSRVALALARTRLMAAKFPYYLLADSPEGIKKEAELGCGTAFQAVGETPAANPTGMQAGSGVGAGDDWEYDRDQVRVRQGASLPHWTMEGATYAVTFRLADALPQVRLEAFLRERAEIVRRAEAAGRELSVVERDRLRALHSEKVERFLDAGSGSCVLRDPRAAAIVRDALAHFDGERYDVRAWCVMPNHVHVVMKPRPNQELNTVLHSWKSFSANRINQILGRSGTLWQPESFDHLIRDAVDFEGSVNYVLQNPTMAGLKDWPWSGTDFQAVNSQNASIGDGHGQDARATGDGHAPDARATGDGHGQDARATGDGHAQDARATGDGHAQDARATGDGHDVRKGFVYKRVPHVTLKSIANNPDIREGMTRAQIEQAIARHADQETLFDKPYEDNSRIRVSGPFTVESLSPHRVFATDADQPKGETAATRESSADFATMILDNLRKAGVQNTVKNERLKFDRLDPFAGEWIQATGEYTEADGSTKRVAVSIGPEFGTVGPQQVKEAAKEAVRGLGFDILIVCGFAFDPHVSEEAKRFGKLQVLITRMNPDLAMGDELLKKTGAGNLFMVFGEPDVDIQKDKAGQLTVEIKGVDVYDPTTGQIRNSSTDDIACWFIDSAYNGESFFVRHAYFCGGDQPYEKLQRALRADIDEAAWSSLYSTKSRPFPRPTAGKIAIKVINHYGDEVLKVFTV